MLCKDNNTPHLTIGRNQQNCFVYYWEGGQNIMRGSKYRYDILTPGSKYHKIYWPRGQYIGGSKYRLTPARGHDPLQPGDLRGLGWGSAPLFRQRTTIDLFPKRSIQVWGVKWVFIGHFPLTGNWFPVNGKWSSIDGNSNWFSINGKSISR